MFSINGVLDSQLVFYSDEKVQEAGFRFWDW
jgi:hypothetical protein